MKHFFYKGSINLLNNTEDETLEDKIAIIKKEFAKLLESKNLSFLLGSGCSMGNYGIPTMKKLAEDFYEPSEKALKEMPTELRELILSKANKKILDKHKIDFEDDNFKDNLENFLGTLFSLKFYFEQVNNEKEVNDIEKVILNTKQFILFQCLNKHNNGKDEDVLDNYRNFYRKLSLRDSNLPKPNVFTTNYDLYSERTMDELGITYANGFSGFVERYFNPSVFNYALAEQMDISSLKWNVIDNFIYLFKIHGSINWIEVQDSNKLFKIKELQDSTFNFLSSQKNLMIYPSPIKQNASLGTPYSDLFREFQKRIARNQSVLVTIGYSFSDEHINNLIYQSLTIPTFRLVIFSSIGKHVGKNYEALRMNIQRLKDLNDPRIWIIGSDSEFSPRRGEINKEKALHHFETISKELLPDWTENKIEAQNEKIIELINSSFEK